MTFFESALGAVARVGPYFAVVSLIPSAGLVYSLYVLVAARPWTGSPDWALALDQATDVSFSGVVAGAMVVAAIALVLHPLQFSLVQFLEGYWGTGRLARRAAAARIRYHLDRLDAYEDTSSVLDEKLSELQGDNRMLRAEHIDLFWERAEARRAMVNYPEQPDELLPTRLGNIMRRYETMSGRPYGLRAVVVGPHLALVAPEGHTAYLGDQRTQLDLTVRLAVTSAILAIATTLLLAPCGWWLLLAAGPYGLAYLFYRGSCVAAHNWGTALQTLIDVDRFDLYRAMLLPLPADLETERSTGALLTGVLLQRAESVNLSLDNDPPAP